MKSLKGKRLLILGGGTWLSIIKDFAEQNGIILISAGNQPDSILASVNEYYNVDSTNHEDMKALIKNQSIDGVYIGSNEKVIRHAVEYVKELGLPCYCTLEQWDALMNKQSFKKLCRMFDIPVVEDFKYTPDEPCVVSYPVITKPSDGSGSIGITICSNETELEKGYWCAYENSPSRKVIVEKCVKNTGMDVFFQITNGNVEWCTLGDKYSVQFEKDSGSVAGARVLPSIYTEEFRSRFEEKLKKLFKYLNLRQGLIWMEVFHDNDVYYFNEVGYRPNGSLSIVGIDYLCGINTVAADMYFALTGKGVAHGFPSLILKEVPRDKKKVCEYWIASNSGTIGEIKGLTELSRHKNILAFFPKYGVGSTIPYTKGFAQNFCVIHFAYDTEEEMREIIRYIRDTVFLFDQNGKDMIIHKSEDFINDLIKSNFTKDIFVNVEDKQNCIL